jgi:two-component system sensor histidine kinase KdpD
MSRLESGQVKLDLGSHTAEELIASALSDCKNVAAHRHTSLDIQNPEAALWIDLSLAKKVLIHLVNNAHLYSSPGRPIAIAAEERDSFLWISVADEGPGIKESEVQNVFEKFYRGKDHRYRVHGTGMGLPIAKAIVEAHGGQIAVVSRTGQGSVFTFSLPVEKILSDTRGENRAV